MTDMAVEDFPAFGTIVRGQIEDLPTQVSNVVRIFISSTFTDTVEERNRLIKEVFPDLRRYCQNKGLDFEVVDMRWGVRDTATSDHLTSELCLREIENCKRLSLGPSFVAILGNKYGYRPIPATIPSSEFETLRELARKEANSDDIQPLEDWFRQDCNAVPPMHILQPITTKLKDYYNEKDLEKRKRDRNQWWEIFEKLQSILRMAAECAVREGIYREHEMHKYFFSVTEEEVRQGIEGSSHQSENSLFFLRDIEGIEDHLDSPNIRRFLDVSEEGVIDAEAQSHLVNLKTNVIGETNVHKFTIPWSPNGIDPSVTEHSKYLDDFCETFKRCIKTMIDKRLETRSKVESQAAAQLYEEMLHHASFCFKKCSMFRGRQDILKRTRDYLASHPGKPLVVYGVSGSGKTSVMAMIAKQARNWLGNSSVVIFRFLGTSAYSSSILETLSSVCRQICFAYEIDQPSTDIIEDFTKLVQHFRHLVSTVPNNEKPLLLLFDSIDQLISQNDAHSMHWLPKRFPKYVHVAVSMLPKLYGCLDNLRDTLTDEVCYHEMQPVPSETGLEIMEGWLEQKSRTLTKKQTEAVGIAFQKCPQPLFLKLLFEDFVQWRSYEEVGKDRLPSSVRHAITTLFEELEHKHGWVLMSHALSYLTAAKNGRTETELEDVLSCDDEVLNDVYQYWDPPVDTIVRIPASLWKRIHYDIEEFLVERQADGKTVVAWYHRQFWEAAQDRYLGSTDIQKERHKLLARMFLGEFSEGTIHPITLHARGKTFENADRQTALQPLLFSNDVFNLRKLQELPHHLVWASMDDTLAEKVLFNFHWLFVKLRAFSFLELMSDFQITSKEIGILQEMMFLASSNLKADPFSLAGQLIGRLSDYRKDHPKLESLLNQAKSWVAGNAMPIMIPRSTCLMQPGGPLRVTLAGHPTRVLKVACTSSGKLLISACEDSEGHIMANVWDLDILELVHTLQLNNSVAGLKGHLCMTITDDDHYVLIGHRTLGMFDLHNGECIRHFNTDNSIVYTDLQATETYVFAGCKEGKKVCVWNIADGKCVSQLDFGDTVPHIFIRSGCQIVGVCLNGSMRAVDFKNGVTSWESSAGCEPVTSAILTPSETEVITGNADNVIRVWQLEHKSVEAKLSLSGHKKPVTKLMIKSKIQLISASVDSTLRVWDLSNGSTLFTLADHSGAVTCMFSIPGGNLLVSGSKDDTLKIWDATTGEMINTLEGHSSWISDVTAANLNEGVRVISGCNDKTVKIWIPTQHVTSSLARHNRSPRAIAVSSDGRYVVTSAWQENTKIWCAVDGTCLHVISTECTSVIISPDDDESFVAGDPKGQLYCWKLASANEVWSFAAHIKGVSCLYWGHHRDLLTAGGCEAKLWDTNNRPLGSPKVVFKGHEAEITTICMTRNHDAGLVVTGCKKGVVNIWRYESGECLQTVSHNDKVECLAISNSDRLLASGSKDGTVSVWSLEAGDLGHPVATSHPTDDTMVCVVFTKDEKQLICGTHTVKKQLFLWDYQLTGTESNSCRFLEGHHHAVMVSKITSDGKYLLTSSRDCTVKAWDVSSGRLVASFDCQSQIKYFDFAEIGRDRCFVAAATKMAIVFLDVMLSEEAERGRYVGKEKIKDDTCVKQMAEVTEHDGEIILATIPTIKNTFHEAERNPKKKQSKICEVV